jgi:hypothetical protein
MHADGDTEINGNIIYIYIKEQVLKNYVEKIDIL